MKTSSEVATLVGIKRQRIQEYEKAGIALKPKIIADIGCTVKLKLKGSGKSSFIKS